MYFTGFHDNLHTEKIGSKEWILTREFEYVTKDWQHIVVPVGFKTDLTSIKPIFRLFMPRASGPHVEAAVIHDYLLVHHNSRKYADKVFLEAMSVNGVNPVLKWIAYFFVRCNSILKSALKR